MSRTERTISATPEQVFAVLADGWSYSAWVVGTDHIRQVDETWPAAGSRLHVTVGPWPVAAPGTTTMVSCEPPHRMVMCPRVWPLGELTVTITLVPDPDGRTRVVLEEEFTGGALRGLRNKINDGALEGRNREALRRLAHLVEHGPTA
ncbi:SRPBCC family protein [Longispora urticae]